MATHVALLRGINLGGKNKVAMADLRALVGELGHTDVSTYIQSGNVLFSATGDADAAALALALALLAHQRIDVEDTVAATVRFAGGAIGTITAATSAYPGTSVRLAVHGDRGSAVIDREELAYFHALDAEQSGDHPEHNQAVPMGGAVGQQSIDAAHRDHRARDHAGERTDRDLAGAPQRAPQRARGHGATLSTRSTISSGYTMPRSARIS